MIRGPRLYSLIVSAAWLASATVGQADWLVLKDGAQIELKGTWKVSGKRVVFTPLDGKLSSLRADQVDLEASARVTEQALRASQTEQAEKTEAKEPARPKARWSFSDKDFAKPPAAETPAGAEGSKEGAAATPPPPKSDLEVLVWSQTVDPARNRIKVAGTLQNSGAAMAASVALVVQLIDRQGVVVGEQSAGVKKASLAPGESTEFSVSFPQVVNFDTVKFLPTGTMLKVDSKGEQGKAAPPPGAE
jgi:hypothetical protein